MYYTLLFVHSAFRWLVLISLLVAIYTAYRGYSNNGTFTKTDNRIRHWTATIAHIQLLAGILLYTQSPIIKNYFPAGNSATQPDGLFFGLIHSVLMLSAIVMITIGSAAAKRKATPRQKYKTMLLWFSAALLLILAAIPWPFSPLAGRPYFRSL